MRLFSKIFQHIHEASEMHEPTLSIIFYFVAMVDIFYFKLKDEIN
jgi:hypothetical protein